MSDIQTCSYCGHAVDPYDLDTKITMKHSGEAEVMQFFHRKCLEEMPKDEFDRLWKR